MHKRIAVCLSGQPRAFEEASTNIKTFFDNPDYQVDYFCHVWNYITWKNIANKSYDDPEIIDIKRLEKLKEFYNPIDFQIGTIDDPSFYQKEEKYAFDSMFLSIMLANQMKKRYEAKHGFIYDVVIRSRYDVVFKPFFKIALPKVEDKSIYFTWYTRYFRNYHQINGNDIYFYGDSWGMDIATDYYRLLIKTSFNEQDPKNFLGPEVSLFKHLNDHNVIIRKQDQALQCTILRPEAKHLNITNDWNQIVEICDSYYRP